jgi:hypothetical protein
MPKIHIEINYVSKRCKTKDRGSLFPRIHTQNLNLQPGESTFLRNVLNLKNYKMLKRPRPHCDKRKDNNKIRRILWYRYKVLAIHLFFDFIKHFLYFRIIISVISFFTFSFMINLTLILILSLSLL